MTRPYHRSRLRVLILTTLLALAAGVMVAPTLAQAPPAGSPAATDVQPRGKGVFALVMDNIDVIFITIGVLSIVGLTLTIQGFLQNRRAALMPDDSIRQMRDMIAQKKFKELLEFTEADNSFVSASLNAALKRAPDFDAMKEAMETTVGEQTAERFRKIEYLNIIGNLGPLLGLLGTVWGMIIAFSEMDAAGGNASPAQLAGGVSKALAHTFLGLGLAVPCLAAFGVLRTLIDRRTIEAGLLGEELLLAIRPTDARAAAAPGRPVTGIPQPTAPMRRASPSDVSSAGDDR